MRKTLLAAAGAFAVLTLSVFHPAPASAEVEATYNPETGLWYTTDTGDGTGTYGNSIYDPSTGTLIYRGD